MSVPLDVAWLVQRAAEGDRLAWAGCSAVPLPSAPLRMMVRSPILLGSYALKQAGAEVPRSRRHLPEESGRQAFPAAVARLWARGGLVTGYYGSPERGVMIYRCRGRCRHICAGRAAACCWPLPGASDCV
jgi:hypothetical protein